MKVKKYAVLSSDNISMKAEQFYLESQLQNYKRTDRFFALLMPLQWLAGVIMALVVSPRTWSGVSSSVHIHVWAAIILGGTISLLPSLLAIYRPGALLTRQVVAIGQMLTSSLLIHLSGGRIETHFHIFGSLALLAFYRDRGIFPTATVITAADHFIRGVFFPFSVFGTIYASPWRSVEHAAWVLFEVACLAWSCKVSNADSKAAARSRALEIQQRHAQKMESIGQLAAGIAHEINTPIQFIGDNMRFLRQECSGLKTLLNACAQLTNDESADLKQLSQAARQVDAEFLSEEVPKALDQSLEGISRITRIVGAMKEFSHPGRTEKQAVDLNRAIESTAVVSTNEWKYVAEMEMDFDPALPLVPCIVGEFNQVILNLIVNAAHAIAEVQDRDPGGKGRIILSTKKLTDKVEIRIQDSGAGIPPHVADKIFDPFFTTKEVGKGTGQGLSIARSIIVNKHAGTINFESKAGVGTTFILTLPLTETADNNQVHNQIG